MENVTVGCTAIDHLLGGSLEPGIITLIYGEPGTGKTNICLQASRNCALTGQRVVYVTSDPISQTRLRQISGNGCEKIVKNILFFFPKTLKDQEKIMDQAIKITCGLIVVDTANKLYRLQICDDESAATRSLTRQIVSLQLAAKKKGIPILVTGQVYDHKDGVKPFASRVITPLAKTVVKLEKIGYINGKQNEDRMAILIKHRVKKKKAQGIFTITAQGLK